MEHLAHRLQEIKSEIIRLKKANEEIVLAESKKSKELERLKRIIEIQNSSIKELELKLKIKRIADSVNDEQGNNRDLKFKINDMIGEVDKIISLMHQ
jgi:predicted mannosyl-3-phosphoglycerate phosphatase (HAD superfamily)